MPSNAEPSEEAPLEEQEIEGEVGDEQIEQAEETSQLEDQLQEFEENPEEQEGEAQEPEIESPSSKSNPKAGVKKTIPQAAKVPLAKTNVSQPASGKKAAAKNAAASASKTAIVQPSKAAAPSALLKTAAKPPALSLKTEKPLSSKQRIYDLVKAAPEGRRVLIAALASTVRKGAAQSMIKLEDESGTIYGVFAMPVKGQVVIQGTVAKDAQGVPFIRITKAVNRENLKN
jgi:hypothetical protein